MNETAVPSDDLPDVAAAGKGDAGRLVLSLSARHPDGRDADYLAWHGLDHRPEQYRLEGLRASQRLVSTAECRAARAASDERYDAVDHVMSYLFSSGTDLGGFFRLGGALNAGGRMPIRLPPVELGVYERSGAAAAPEALVGADVLPWLPTLGAYLLVEEGSASAVDLTAVDGVAGVWWFAGLDPAPYPPVDTTGLQFTCCYLDRDPVEVAARLRPALDERWAGGAVRPLLAAPFHEVVAHEWDRYLP